MRAGTYREKLSLTRSGTAGAPITFAAYPGETPIIDGGDTLPASYGGLINVSGNYNVIDGLEVTRSAHVGIAFYGQHNLVKNAYVHHIYQTGIGLYGDYNTAEYNEVYRASLVYENGTGTTWSTGIVASRDPLDGLTSGSIIRHNTVAEVWGQGINTYESDGTLIEDNAVRDSSANNFYLSDTTNSILRRNFSYFTAASYVKTGARVGILLGDEQCTPKSGNNTIVNNISSGGRRNLDWYSGCSSALHDTVIANNTFVNSAALNNVQFSSGTFSNVTFENNIVLQDDNLPVLLNLASGLIFRNNLWWTSSPGGGNLGTGSLVADPLLARSGLSSDPNWYRLQAASPARGAALPLPQAPTDFFGTPRPPAPDVGAAQYWPNYMPLYFSK